MKLQKASKKDDNKEDSGQIQIGSVGLIGLKGKGNDGQEATSIEQNHEHVLELHQEASPFWHLGWRCKHILAVHLQPFSSFHAAESSTLLNVCNIDVAERILKGDLSMFHEGLGNAQHGLAISCWRWRLGFVTRNDRSGTTIGADRAGRRYWYASLNVIGRTCTSTCKNTFRDWLHS